MACAVLHGTEVMGCGLSEHKDLLCLQQHPVGVCFFITLAENKMHLYLIRAAIQGCH